MTTINITDYTPEELESMLRIVGETAHAQSIGTIGGEKIYVGVPKHWALQILKEIDKRRQRALVEEHARRIYRAYVLAVNEPYMRFDRLSDDDKDRWRAVAKAAIRIAKGETA